MFSQLNNEQNMTGCSQQTFKNKKGKSRVVQKPSIVAKSYVFSVLVDCNQWCGTFTVYKSGFPEQRLHMFVQDSENAAEDEIGRFSLK